MAWLVLLITNTLAVKVVLWHMGEPTNRYGEKFPNNKQIFHFYLQRSRKLFRKQTSLYIQGVPKIVYYQSAAEAQKTLPKLSFVGQNFPMDKK